MYMTQEEMWGLNGLNSLVQNTQAELQRQVKATEAFIKLLEIKYDAVYDPLTGKLEPKESN